MPPRAQKISKKQQDSGKRYQIALRVGYEMRKALEGAAAKSGRGLAAEAEERIGWTFRLDQKSELDTLRIMFGPFLGVLLLAGMAAQNAGSNYFTKLALAAFRAQQEGKPLPPATVAPATEPLLSLQHAMSAWIAEPAGYLWAADAAYQVIKAFCPPGDRHLDLFPEADAEIRVHVTSILNQAQTNPDLALIRSVLGDLLKRLPAPTPLPEGWHMIEPGKPFPKRTTDEAARHSPPDPE
jgi:hypothetical protein